MEHERPDRTLTEILRSVWLPRSWQSMQKSPKKNKTEKTQYLTQNTEQGNNIYASGGVLFCKFRQHNGNWTRGDMCKDHFWCKARGKHGKLLCCTRSQMVELAYKGERKKIEFQLFKMEETEFGKRNQIEFQRNKKLIHNQFHKALHISVMVHGIMIMH